MNDAKPRLLSFLLPAALLAVPALLLLDNWGRVFALTLLALIGLTPAILTVWHRNAAPEAVDGNLRESNGVRQQG